MPYTNRGVLPRQELARLYKRKTPAIMPDDGCAPSIQPAGLDLRLGTTALRIQASVLPQAGKSVAEKAAEVQMAAMELAGPTVLERGAIYLVRLCETLALPANVRAKANPKSTTGRIDVFVRVICDGATRYDTVPSGYHGPLWLEIVPRSFSVLVEAGISLAQLRLMRGTTECPPPLGAHSGEKVEGVATGIDLSVDLEEGNGHGTIAWKATRNAPLLELGAPPCIPSFCQHQNAARDRCSMSMFPNVSINGRIRSSGQLGRWWYSISPCRNNECVRRFTVFAFNQRS